LNFTDFGEQIKNIQKFPVEMFFSFLIISRREKKRKSKKSLVNIPVVHVDSLLRNPLQLKDWTLAEYVIDQQIPFENRCIHEKLLPRQVTLKLLMSFSTSLPTSSVQNPIKILCIFI
jgi:hypothetical protein